MTHALRPEPEDLANQGSVVVRYQIAVDEAVAGLGTVDPLAFSNGLLHSHADVLGELLSVELRERPDDVEIHAARRGGEVEILSDRVQPDATLDAQLRQQDQVTEVAGE